MASVLSNSELGKLRRKTCWGGDLNPEAPFVWAVAVGESPVRLERGP